LWEVATGHERLRVDLPNAGLRFASFSPRGDVVAAGTTSGTVIVVDATDGRERTRLTGQDAAVSSIAFSADGRMLATGGADGAVLLWDAKGWAGKGRDAMAVLKPAERAAYWEDLRDEDAGKAFRAILAFAASPGTSGPYLKERLAAVAGGDERRVARCIENLDADEFDVRESAQKELEKMESLAIPAVRQALKSDPSMESRRRLQELLDRRKDSTAFTEEARVLRALEALERSGAPEAVDALRALAKDAPNAPVKQEAVAALDRLSRRIAAP
jgi:hypothetical protein